MKNKEFMVLETSGAAGSREVINAWGAGSIAEKKSPSLYNVARDRRGCAAK